MPEKCPYCDKQIEDTWEQRVYEGYVLWVDTANNDAFVHRHNFPEYYKRTTPSGKKATPSEVGKALVDLLVDENDENAATKTLLLMELGDIASSGKGAERSRALETALRLIGESGQIPKPLAGVACKVCGRTGEAQRIVIDASTQAAVAATMLSQIECSPEVRVELNKVEDFLTADEAFTTVFDK